MAFMSSARRWLRHKVPVTTTPAATLAGWLAATVRSEFVLCEPEPSKTLIGFEALGGGAPNTYVIDFPRRHQTDVIAGGMFGQVIGVQEDDAELEAQESIATVDGNPGSWWWDEANELLYVHATDSGDPDDAALVQAAVRFYLSNAPITLLRTSGEQATAVAYLPWLTDDLPQIQRIREDLLFGSMDVPTGNVSFINGHGAWFTLVAPDGLWNWKNKRMRFFIGGDYGRFSMTRDQFAAVATMRIDDAAPNEQVCQFPLQPLQNFAQVELPVTPYFGGDYPALGAGVEGTKKWIGYGRTTMRPDLTDVTGLGVYTVADAAFQTLFAVHQVWAIEKATDIWTLLTLTTDYTVDLTACTVTVVNATYIYDDYELAVDVTGKPDGLGSYFRAYATVVRDVLETFLGATNTDIDTAAFATAAAAATNEISLWIKSPRQLTSLLATVEQGLPSLGRSSMGTVQQTVDGAWTTSIWDPDVAGITTTLRRSDFASFLPKPKLKTIFPTVRVFYNYDHARDSWSVEEADDPTTRYRTGSRERLDLYTYLTTATDAYRLAQRYQLLAGAVTVEAEFVERGAILATTDAGGKALVTYSPAPALAGAYENQPFEALQLLIRLAPKLNVSGLLGNFHGLSGKVGKWMGPLAPDWTDATPTERQTQGFWCDSNGRADPADPASANQSIWF